MKIIVHAHTSFSNDGDLSPQQLADVAERGGFQAVLVSDHFESLTEDKFRKLVRECSAIRNCLMVTGYERSWRGYHVLALGVQKWFDNGNIIGWAQEVKAAGGILVLAHPTRYRHDIPDDILAVCDGIEVWNSKTAYDGSIAPNPRAYKLLGSGRYPLCGQDIHGLRHATSVAVELRRSCSTAQEIIDCIKQRDYWMSNRSLRFGASLPHHIRMILHSFHGCRSLAVTLAIKVRPLVKHVTGALRRRRS